jgi:hypothetical protein
MEIDIIDYTEQQYAALTESQVLRVQASQLQKNTLIRRREEEKKAEKSRLLEQGIFLSPIWELYCAELDESYAKRIENVRDSLLFYLRYTQRASEEEISKAPYTVNYALSDAERLAVVRQYYETAYPDPIARFDAFKLDTVAPKYISYFYGALYDTFLEASREAGSGA